VLWEGGLEWVERRRGNNLVVSRRALVVQDRRDPERYVQKGEIVSHEWHTRVPAARPDPEGHEPDEVAPG
jgi:hypothetical protein